jgi:hypothetical protein
MLNEPLTNARIPEQSDGPLGGLQIGYAVKDLAKFTIPRYATSAARDTAFAAWVTQGGVMTSGLYSDVNGNIEVYRSGTWQRVNPDATVASMRNIGGHPLTASAWTLIPFTLEDIDSDNGHSTSTNNDRWFAQKARWYVVSAQVSFTHSTASTLSYRGVRMRINGTTGQLPGATTMLPVAANGRVSVATAAIPVWMEVGDWVDVQAYHNASDAITTYSDTEFASALHIFSHR